MRTIMAMLTGIPNLLLHNNRIASVIPHFFHYLSAPSGEAVKPGGIFETSFRTKIRCYFPRPSERKRIKRHGWQTRMSTPSGRKIIMNRILKGRHVYTH